MASWRAMRAADLPAVMAIAAEIHPAYPEEEAVLAERLALHPPGCRVLEDPAGAVGGYLIAHPWLDLRPPPLDRRLGALPDAPGCLHLHDLALLPPWRGTGSAGEAVAALLASRRLPATLVAVGRAQRFWRRFGFLPAGDEVTAGLIAGYGVDSTYMRLP